MYCEALALSLGKLWIFWLEGITTDAGTEGKKRYTHTHTHKINKKNISDSLLKRILKIIQFKHLRLM